MGNRSSKVENEHQPNENQRAASTTAIAVAGSAVSSLVGSLVYAGVESSGLASVAAMAGSAVSAAGWAAFTTFVIPVGAVAGLTALAAWGLTMFKDWATSKVAEWSSRNNKMIKN